MVTRAYDFDSGIETDAAPTVSAPSAPGDVLTLGSSTTFTIANNHAAADVTGLLFDKATYRMFAITYSIYRSASGGSTRAQAGILMGVTDGTNWELSDGPAANCPNTDDAGVDFSITSAGQVQYVSDDNGGSYSAANSIMKWELFQLLGV